MRTPMLDVVDSQISKAERVQRCLDGMGSLLSEFRSEVISSITLRFGPCDVYIEETCLVLRKLSQIQTLSKFFIYVTLQPAQT